MQHEVTKGKLNMQKSQIVLKKVQDKVRNEGARQRSMIYKEKRHKKDK